jgi:hypothetical protein
MKKPARKEQNEIAHNYLKGSDLQDREEEVLKEASEKLGFAPSKLIGRSSWWGSTEIGAFHYAGEIEGKRAVLKIQGVKPSVSEIDMINNFNKTNKSKLVRPPHLYAYLNWNDEKRYEALALEFIEGEKVIKTPTNKNEVHEFFEIYKDYRENCLSFPWVDKPTISISQKIADNFSKWREASFKIYPNHPLREKGDTLLIDQAVQLLIEKYKGIDMEFMHGHFSEGDLYKVNGQIVILSNLFWSWRPPLYDSIFAYHWFIYHLNDVDRITSKEVEEQRSIWLNEIKNLPQTQGSKNQELLNLVLLERAVAGLNLDALSANPNKPITKYLFEATRREIKRLILLLVS